ncbi:MAG: Asp23/Gls24 family envelope stress response protein [Chloroflexi bacterium]|nr:Asp23/Gls24 family envelope stress response protein [Chloroflexota bacterium]
MTEETISLGRIEVAPEVIATIARLVVSANETVTKMGNPPSGRLFSRAIKQEGVVLHYENSKLIFDIYVFMDPRGNIRQASRTLQGAIIEAMDQMVGIPVEAVNIHVEDVTYQPDQAA